MLSSLRQVSRSAGTLRATRTRSRPTSFALTRSLVTQKYSADHESIKYDDETGIGTVTITEFAQTSLGDVVFVELPETGSTIEKGQTIGAVESVKAASDVYSPVSGEVISINETLGDQPSLLNKSPEDKGWLFQVKLSNPAELDELMTAERYKEHCSS